MSDFSACDEIDATRTAGAGANTLVGHILVLPETRAERYARLSNEAADCAARYGAEGDDHNAEVYARCADNWADLAAAIRFIELGLERLP